MALWLSPLLPASSAGAATAEPEIERQRVAFVAAWAAAEHGRWEPAGDTLDLLERYVLFPDLRAAWLRARLSTAAPAEVEAFLAAHPGLPATGELRRRWLDALEQRRDWPRYLALYERHFSERADPRLRCVALRAAGTDQDTFVAAALELWTVGVSQPKACDPVFAELERRGELTPQRYRARLTLAIEARQISLARYLARKLDAGDRNRVERWARMQSDPGAALRDAARLADTPGQRDLVAYGFRQLMRRDPLESSRLWRALGDRFSFDRDTAHAIEREIALAAARRHMPQAATLLAVLGDAASTTGVLEWRMRLAALAGDWQGLLDAHTGLPDEAALREPWRYWQARALEGSGEAESAARIFADLAVERSYHGFLAADRLERPYAWAHRPIEPDEAIIGALAARPALIRARELFFVGQDSRGRSEWNLEIDGLGADERAQAALLAHRWGWHSRAISAAAQAGALDDLEVRYPTPFRHAFDARAPETRVATTWAYGIARSESLFMPDVASGAGALGLMQLLPSTGRETARRASVTYRGSASLLEPETNIALGIRYLGSMYERFDRHRVLATAAYNAGPRRVSDWLPDRTVPADAWVDAIPLDETRAYVQRVLSAEAIFYWRLHDDTQRLSTHMPPVGPAGDSRVASDGVARSTL